MTTPRKFDRVVATPLSCTLDFAGRVGAIIVAALPLMGMHGMSAGAQQIPGGWSADLDVKQVPVTPVDPASPSAGGTTIVKKKDAPPAQQAPDVSKVRLVALLTADGQRIDQDVVWRVFEPSTSAGTVGKLLSTHAAASPTLDLKAGTYTINAAFGRAHLTRIITVAPGVETTEPFVLNAGGLRVRLSTSKAGMEGAKSAFSIETDERDQSGNRHMVLAAAKPDVIIRLNSGIYHIASTLGDANARVEADVTVEAGKLTEAEVAHKAARVTFKLVTREGGEAVPDTEWSVLTPDGHPVKTSIGALPTHILAPGSYMAVAKSQGNVFRRSFEAADGQTMQVEILRQ